MKILDGYWVKPFGTGISCIDTVDAECPRGISLEECMTRCEDSPYCNAGYHVSFKDLPLESYCVPLNTVFYQNSNFLNNIIAPDNSTRLSRDNGVDVRVFYNDKRFPDDVSLASTPYLFYTNSCFLAQDRGKNQKYYLHSDFTFYPLQETAMPVVLGEASSLLVDFRTRLNRDSRLVLFKNDEFSTLYFDPDEQKFSWRPYSSLNQSYEFITDREFIDAGQPFYLFQQRRGIYLSTDEKNRLVWSTKKPEWPFLFEINPQDKTNQVSRALWNDVPRLFPDSWKKLNDVMVPTFLCRNFLRCRDRTAAIPLSTHRTRTMMVVLGTLTVLVWIAIVVFGGLAAARK